MPGLPPVLPMPAATPAPKEELSDLKQDPIIGKYAKMAAMGVPHASVQAKMRLDNIESTQANRILRALGIEAEDDGAGALLPEVGGALAALAAGPGGRAMPRRPSDRRIPPRTVHDPSRDRARRRAPPRAQRPFSVVNQGLLDDQPPHWMMLLYSRDQPNTTQRASVCHSNMQSF